MKTGFFYIIFFACIQAVFGQANFSSNNAKGCAPLTVAFSDNSLNAVKWEWDFGNGNTSVLQNPAAQYTNPGKYTVKLTVWDAAGNSTIKTQTDFVWVYKNPVAQTSMTGVTSCQNEPISFTNNSLPGDANVTQWRWDWGNGQQSTGSSPSFKYSAAGVYDVSLLVTDANGCMDKISLPKFVTINPEPATDFKSNIQYDCTVPSTISFTDLTPGGADNVSWLWYFGDGDSSTAQNPSHTYTAEGTYTVSLLVTNKYGCKKLYKRVNYITLGLLSADFIADKTSFCKSGVANFEYLGPRNGQLLVQWDFGDGSPTEIGFFPRHTYSNAKNSYTVTMTVQSVSKPQCKQIITKTNYIQVHNLPNGQIITDFLPPCADSFIVNAKYVDTGATSKLVWKLFLVESTDMVLLPGDSAKQTFAVTEKEGVKIQVHVTNKYGCKNTILLDSIFKRNNIEPNFNGDSSACIPVYKNFVNQTKSSYPIKKVEWYVDNVLENLGNEFLRYFDTNRAYKFVMKVTDEYGCEDSFKKTVFVGKHIRPWFKLDTIPKLCSNQSYWVPNLTKNPGWDIDSFIWFNDTQDNIELAIKIKVTDQKNYIKYGHNFRYDRDSGYASPMLIVINNSCYDTLIKIDSIYIKGPHARIKVDYNPCNDSLVRFFNISNKPFNRWKWLANDKVFDMVDPLILPANRNFNVQLTLYDDSTGCKDDQIYEFKVISPKIDPIIKVDGNCVPVTLGISNSEENRNTKWFINDSVFIPTYGIAKELIIDTAGLYKVHMIYELGLCQDTFTKYFRLYDKNLNGSVSLLAGCSPSMVQLVDSTYSPTNFHFWSLHDRFFPVTAKVMTVPLPNASGGDTNYIILSNGNNQYCPAEIKFAVWANTPSFKLNYGFVADCNKIELQANAQPNTKRGNGPYTFQWDFSKGGSSTEQIIKYVSNDTGWQYAAIKVTDANGCFVVDTLRFNVPASKLKANFKSVKTGSVCTPMQVQFYDLSTTVSGKIMSWKWDFGDGSFSTIQNPVHQYLKQGVYTVSLTITDENNCKQTIAFPNYLELIGLKGSYSFDKNKGCAPLTIHFTDTSNSPASKYEWDFGNGVIVTGENPTYTYTKPGMYIPSLIIREKAGCFFAVPQTDTIFVYEKPKVSFTGKGTCLNENILFTSTSTTIAEPIVKYGWYFPDATPIIGPNNFVYHRFADKNNTWIRLIGTAANGCSDTANSTLVLKGPKLFINGTVKNLCLGESLTVNGFAVSDTTIENTEWLVNGQPTSTGNLFKFIPAAPGLYKLTYKVRDKMGCWDTLSFAKLVNVGDTIAPPIVPLRFTSVENDQTHQINFYQLPSADFGNYQLWQNNGFGYSIIKTTTNKTDTNFFISGVDALRKSYCYKLVVTNLCNITNETKPLINHCTIEAKATALLNSAKVTWIPYVGWPVATYTVSRLNNLAQTWDNIGTVSGNTYEFTDTNIVCKQNHYYRVMATKHADTTTISFSDTCHALPIYFNIVNPPFFTRATVVNNEFVNMQWEELLPNKNPIINYEIQRLDKANYSQLKWVAASNALSMDDKMVNVQTKPYQYRLRSVDNCLDTSAFVSIARSIHLQTTISDLDRPIAYWTAYKAWPEGVKEYVIEKRNGNSPFTEIARVTGTDTVYTDKLSELNCIPWFEYRVFAIRNVRDTILSYSNQSAPSAYPKIFIPNAFSPNNNKLNEVFRPEGIFISSYTLYVYNRWGQKMYENSECMNGWDGTYMGEPAPDGVYAWYVEAIGIDNKVYKFKGTVTLIR